MKKLGIILGSVMNLTQHSYPWCLEKVRFLYQQEPKEDIFWLFQDMQEISKLKKALK